MGLRSIFRKRPARAGTADATPAAGGPETREPLTVEQLMDLEEAWAELAVAQEASELTNFRACTRSGGSWTEDPAAVRAVAATLREFPAPGPGQPRKNCWTPPRSR
jgi:hypothetical protein